MMKIIKILISITDFYFPILTIQQFGFQTIAKLQKFAKTLKLKQEAIFVRISYFHRTKISKQAIL